MIRTLSTVAIAGLVLCAFCVTLTAVLIGRAYKAGDFEGWENSPWYQPGRIDGGPTETDHYEWNGTDELDINVPAEVVYTQGPVAGINITGPRHRLDRITVDGGEIDIIRRNPRIRGNELRIEVQAPSVHFFEFNGAQDVKILNYDQDEISIEANGAAGLQAVGRARIVRLKSNGAGSVDMTRFAVQDMQIEMNGASDVTAGPTGRAEIELNGAGDVTLLGQPREIKQEVHGMGKVHVRPTTPTTTTPPGATAPVTRP